MEEEVEIYSVLLEKGYTKAAKKLKKEVLAGVLVCWFGKISLDSPMYILHAYNFLTDSFFSWFCLW